MENCEFKDKIVDLLGDLNTYIPGILTTFILQIESLSSGPFAYKNKKEHIINTNKILIYNLTILINSNIGKVLEEIDKYEDVKEKEKEWKSQNLKP